MTNLTATVSKEEKAISANLNKMIVSKELDQKIVEATMKFCSKNNVTIHSLLTSKNLLLAERMGIITAKNATAKTTATQKVDLLKAEAEKQKAIKDAFAKVSKIVKEIAQKTFKPTLFRLTWKDDLGKRGIDVYEALPLIPNGRLNLVGRAIYFDKTANDYIVSDSIFALEADTMQLQGGKVILYGGSGKANLAELFIPTIENKPEVKVAVKTVKKTVKKPVKATEKPVEATKEEKGE